ncbi:MAG TPA: hypothetical protein DCY89_07030 [Gammaproteobacteria bacterium]|nr:hypothetical protein [Gammaproteobacteria bacterium]
MPAPILQVLLLILAGVVFAPGLAGPFLLDDGPNFAEVPQFIEATRDCNKLDLLGLTSHSGPLGRPVAMLSFALNHCAHGLAPFPFKLTNLGLHLATACLVLLLVHLLLRSPRFQRLPLPPRVRAALPWLVALGWLVMPLHVSTVLYVVQRMTILAALFTLLGLCLYLVGRLRLLAGGGRAAFACFALVGLVCLPLAALSKENGLLLPLLCLVIEFACFGPAERPRALSRVLGAGALGGALFVGGAAWWQYTRLTTWLDGLYAYRDFTLPERLATEVVVLGWYAWMSVAPDISQLGLFHDDFPILDFFRDPIVGLVGAVWLALALLALWLRDSAPWLLLGLGLFLVGHAMEASFLPLELVFEHRNYLPAVGLIAGGLIGLAVLLRARPQVFLAISLAWIGTTAVATSTHSSGWADHFDLHARELANHPHSERALIWLAGMLHEAHRASGDIALGEQALALYERGLEQHPDSILALIGRLLVLKDLDRDTDEAFRQTRDRLAAPRVHPSVIAAIDAAMDMAMDTKSKVSGGLDGMQIAALASTVLENPGVLPAIRVDLGARLAVFYVNTAGDFPAALRILDAVAEDLNDPFDLKVTRYRLYRAIHSPQLPAMREELRRLAEDTANPIERARRRALLAFVFREAAPSGQPDVPTPASSLPTAPPPAAAPGVAPIAGQR